MLMQAGGAALREADLRAAEATERGRMVSLLAYEPCKSATISAVCISCAYKVTLLTADFAFVLPPVLTRGTCAGSAA